MKRDRRKPGQGAKIEAILAKRLSNQTVQDLAAYYLRRETVKLSKLDAKELEETYQLEVGGEFEGWPT